MNKRPLCLICIVPLLLLAFFILTNCSTEEPGGGGGSKPEPPKDTMAPAEVSELTAITANGSVTFNWQDPADADFKAVEITFIPEVSGIEQPISIIKGEQTAKITGLMNGTNYTFKVQTLDNTGNRSTGTELMASPDGDAPTALISYPGGAYTKEPLLDFTITFSEPVEGFTIEDILTKNCTLSNLVQHNVYTYGVKAGVLTEGELSLWIPANAVHDKSMNGNPESAVFSIIYDSTLPIPVIASQVTAITNKSPVGFSVTFPEEMTGFELSDLIVKNGSAGNLVTADNRVFTFDVIPATDGEVGLEINNGAALDVAGNSSVAAKSFYFIYDKTAPTSVMSSAVPAKTNQRLVPFTASFSEEVTGFELSDLLVTNGSASQLVTIDNKLFTFQVIPAADGEVTISIKDGAANDRAGNLSRASQLWAFTYDATIPQVQISSTVQSHTNLPLIPFRAVFTEEVKGFDASDIVITGGNAHGVTKVDALTYSFEVTPAAADVSLFIKEAGLTDIAGNSNIKSNSFSFAFDSNQPTVSLTTLEPAETNKKEIAVSINFSEAVTGFTIDDIAALNCTLNSLTEVSVLEYKLLITPTADGAVELSIAADIALDSSANGNLASNKLSLVYDSTPPAVPTVTGEVKTENARPTWGWDKPIGATAFAYRLNSGAWQNIDNANVTSFMAIDELMVGTHKFEVKARDAVGNWSMPGTFSTETYIEVPVSFNIINYGAVKNVLKWWSNSAVSGLKYQLERAQGTATNYEVLYTSTEFVTSKVTTEYVDESIEENMSYTYRVKVFNSRGESDYSYWTATTTPAKPVAPTGLQFSYVEKHIPALRFTDNSNNESGFDIFVSEAPGGLKTLQASSNTNNPYLIDYGYSDFVKNDGYYYYTVRAFKTYGGVKDYSADSNEIKVYLLSKLVGSSTSLSTNDYYKGKGALLSWTHSIDGESGFIIERREYSIFSQVGIAPPAPGPTPGRTSAVNYVDETAYDGIYYYYRVRAFKESKEHNIRVYESSYSNEAQAFKKLSSEPIIINAQGQYSHNGELLNSGDEKYYTLMAKDAIDGVKITLTSANANVSAKIYPAKLSAMPVKQFGEGETVLSGLNNIALHYIIQVTGITPSDKGNYQLKVVHPSSIEMVFAGQSYPLNEQDVNFNTVDYNTVKSFKLGIINTGKGPLTINDIKIVNDPEGNYLLSKPASPIPDIAPKDISGTTQLEIKFAPKTQGPKTATLEILSNSFTRSSYKIKLIGEMLPPLPQMEVYDGLDVLKGFYLGNVKIGSKVTRTIMLKNVGYKDLHLTGNKVYSQSSEVSFDTTDMLSVIPPGVTTAFMVSYSPTTAGSISNTYFNIESDCSKGPLRKIYINGHVQAPDILVKDEANKEVLLNSRTSFKKVVANYNAGFKEYTIENQGDLELVINSISLSDNLNFTLEQPAIMTIQPGMSEKFRINVTAKEYPYITTEVNIVTNDPRDNGSYKFVLDADVVNARYIDRYNSLYESELASNSDIKWFYFRVKANQKYNLIWEERDFSSGVYSANIKIQSYLENFNQFFGVGAAGYNSPYQFTAPLDGIIILKVETESMNNSLDAGTFSLKVTELP